MNQEFEAYIATAIKWAQEHFGATEYAGRCLSFVEDAYEKSNHVEIFGGSSAQESADEYGAAQNRGEPPLGAFVFYACAGPVEARLTRGQNLLDHLASPTDDRIISPFRKLSGGQPCRKSSSSKNRP
jgi:hypothetical protein